MDDASQQPGENPEPEPDPHVPSLTQYFLGYAIIFGGVVAFALLVVGLMRLLR